MQVSNGTNAPTSESNGPFTLPAADAVASGGSYSITVGTVSGSNQSCAVQSGTGSGMVMSAKVSSVVIYCTYIVSKATLSGSYDYAGFTFDATDGEDLLFIGNSFDGAGNEGTTATVITDLDGTITSATNSTDSAGPYTVTTNANAIPVLTTGGNNVGAIAGADHDEFFWLADATSANGGGLPALAVGVNPLTTATLSSIVGNWTVVSETYFQLPGSTNNPVSEDEATIEGTATVNADGSGSATLTLLTLADSETSKNPTHPAGTFSVTNGQFSNGSGELGYISANGELMVATTAAPQGSASNTPPELAVYLQQGSGVTLATLNGVYAVGTLFYTSYTTAVADGKVFTLFFDGAGNFNGTYLDSTNNTFTTGTASGTYTVTSAGLLTITFADGTVVNGGVTQDGNILAVASVTQGQNPGIAFGLRQ